MSPKSRVRELGVFMNGARVGRLIGGANQPPEFTYDDNWLYATSATPLSVGLPLVERTHTGERLENYLWGLLPDSEDVVRRWASSHKISARDVVGLLSAVGADVAGAAQYLPEGNEPDDPSAGSYEPLTETDIEAFLRELRRDRAAWHPDPAGRWSLAGAQPKIALAYDETAKTWALPIGSAPTTHILKPAIIGLANQELNEHLCLTAARMLRIPAAYTKVARFGEESVLVVQRYDRIRIDGILYRVHQEDFC